MLNVKDLSILHLCETSNHRCGYCRAERGSCTYGLWAESLKVGDYQNLIDLGWRRAGHYIYKPVMDKTCCPQYTIRCEALHFYLTKSQKKVLKRFNQRLTNDKLPKEKSIIPEEEDLDQPVTNAANSILQEMPEVPLNLIKDLFDKQSMLRAANASSIKCDKSPIQEKHQPTPLSPTVTDKALPTQSMQTEQSADLGELPTMAVNLNKEATNLAKLLENPQAVINITDKIEGVVELHDLQGITFAGIVRKGRGAGTSLPECRKAKVVRQEKYAKKAKGALTPKHVSKSLKDFLEEPENVKHEFKTKLVKLNSAEYRDCSDLEYALYKKYQMIVHSDPEVDLSKKDFERFLVKTPLIYTDIYGSYHMQYWWDTKLIAVGVIDVLPFCVSSVYFFYDPDFKFLTLGTYSSLREVRYVQQLHESYPDLQYYYMGYFITSCVKMRYKGNLHPSSLLCPETRNWVSLNPDLISKLVVTKYLRLYTGTPGSGNCESNNEEFSEQALKETFRQMKVISRGNVLIMDEYLERRVNMHQSKYKFMMEVLPLLLNTRLMMSIYVVMD